MSPLLHSTRIPTESEPINPATTSLIHMQLSPKIIHPVLKSILFIKSYNLGNARAHDPPNTFFCNHPETLLKYLKMELSL